MHAEKAMIYAVLTTNFKNTEPSIVCINPDHVTRITEVNEFGQQYAETPDAVYVSMVDEPPESIGLYVQGPLLNVICELTRAHEARHGLSDKTSSQWLQDKLANPT